jgi:hypothetical protein
MIAFGRKISLVGLHFCLLNAEKIGIRLGKKLGKALGKAGSKAVDVPGYKFHDSLLMIFYLRTLLARKVLKKKLYFFTLIAAIFSLFGVT